MLMKAAWLWLPSKSRPMNSMIMCVRDVCANMCKWLFDEYNPLNSCHVLLSTSLSFLLFSPSLSLTHKPHQSSQAGRVLHSCRQHSQPQQSTPSCDVSPPKLNMALPSKPDTLTWGPYKISISCTWVQKHRAEHKPPWISMNNTDLGYVEYFFQMPQLVSRVPQFPLERKNYQNFEV